MADGRTFMSLPALSFAPAFSLLAAVALVGAVAPGHAQSAYSYPWCARYPRVIGGYACYYTSFAQCMATMQGIGGYCMRSPFYRGSAGSVPGRRNSHHGGHT
jgi:hypothetical protein